MKKRGVGAWWRTARSLRRLVRPALVAAGAALAVPPASARAQEPPEQIVHAEDPACQALFAPLIRAWLARADGPEPNPDKAASLPGLWEDYLRVCSCSRLGGNRGIRGHRSYSNPPPHFWSFVNGMPDELWALHEAEYRRRCKPPWVKAGAAAVAVVTATAVALSAGGGDVSAGPPAGTPSPTGGGGIPSPPPSTPTDGSFDCNTQVTGGDPAHPPFIALGTTLRLFFRFQGGTLTVTAQVGENFVPVMGPFDPVTRTGNLTGSGVVAGRPNVGVRLTVHITGNDTATGTYTMGIGGGLPGGTTTDYGLDCRRTGP